MGAAIGVTLVKTHTYRGDTSEMYSNQYWLTGSAPVAAAGWKALFDNLAAEEKKCYPSYVTIQAAYGYNDDTEGAASVASYNYGQVAQGIAGTLTVGAGVQCPGDCAVWVRWKLARNNSKGKPIYLRKYFHPAVAAGSSGAAADQVLAAQRTALQAFGVKLSDGSFPNGNVLRSQHQVETHVSVATSEYVTTRTLKRRGKRPGS